MSREIEMIINGGLPVTLDVETRQRDPEVGEGCGETWDDYGVVYIGRKRVNNPRWVSAKYGDEIAANLNDLFG